MFPGAHPYDESTADSATTHPDAGRDETNFVIVGAPLDVSTTFEPGTRFGPGRIRRYAEGHDDYDHRTDQHFSTLGVADAGDVRAWDDAAEYLDFLEAELRSVVWDDAIPLVLGGEHTVSLASVRAVEPEVFVCLDAHLDLRDEYDGNPLSHSAVTRRILEDESVGIEEAIVVGARTGSAAEWERASEPDVTVVEPEAVPNWLAETDLDDRLDDREVYLSVDVDAADPAFAPGTGTREPFGLDSTTMRDVVRAVAPHAAGFDIVEVNDRDHGQAAALAGRLLREFVFERATSETADE